MLQLTGDLQPPPRILRIDAQNAPAERDAPHNALLLPPTLNVARGGSDQTVPDVITRQHSRGCTLCSACADAFRLGEAGLLTGRRVSTHWALETGFQTRFPEAILATDEILIDGGDIVTAGRMMARLVLSVLLVERYLDSPARTHTARQLLVDPGGRQQSNYRTFRPLLQHADPGILGSQLRMAATPEADLSVLVLAIRTHTAPRTFIRHFKAATCMPPNTYVQKIRVEKAQTLPERTRLPVQEIGWQVGNGDVFAFGRISKSITVTTPGEYRTRFGRSLA